MLIGYARVSTQDQNPDMQVDALRAAGCERIFIEKMSGADRERPQLKIALTFTRPGDTFVVWKTDRLARSLKHLLEIIEDLGARGSSFKSLTEPFDTSSDMGKLVLAIFGALAEFERNIIRMRCRTGIAAAKEKGVKFGREQKISTRQMEEIESRYNDDPDFNMAKVARELGVHEKTIYRRLRERRSMSRSKMEQPQEATT